MIRLEFYDIIMVTKIAPNLLAENVMNYIQFSLWTVELEDEKLDEKVTFPFVEEKIVTKNCI